jgi:hypothetical protein
MKKKKFVFLFLLTVLVGGGFLLSNPQPSSAAVELNCVNGYYKTISGQCQATCLTLGGTCSIGVNSTQEVVSEAGNTACMFTEGKRYCVKKATYPDLIVSDIEVLENYNDKDLYFKIDIKNIGDTTVNMKDVYIETYLTNAHNTNKKINGQAFIKDVYIEAGESSSDYFFYFENKKDYIDQYYAGDANIRIAVDTSNNIDESNEDNNSLYKMFSVADDDVSIGEIADINEEISSNSVLITWRTPVASNASVDYVKNGGTISQIKNKADSRYTTFHSVRIDDLQPETLYKYSITSVDSQGNIYSTKSLNSSELDLYFTTLSIGYSDVNLSWKTENANKCTFSYTEEEDMGSASYKTLTATDKINGYYNFNGTKSFKLDTTYYYQFSCYFNENSNFIFKTNKYSFTTGKEEGDVKNVGWGNIEQDFFVKEKSVIITPKESNIKADGTAYITWSTDLEAICGIDYNTSSDLSGGTGTNGHLIQRATDTNDGKFWYAVDLKNLKENQDYYYRINCDPVDGNMILQKTDIQKLLKYDLSDLYIKNVEVENGKFKIEYCNKNKNFYKDYNFNMKEVFYFKISTPDYTYSGGEKDAHIYSIPSVSKNSCAIADDIVFDTLKFNSGESYNVKVEIDHADQVSESNENNNIYKKELIITGSGEKETNLPDLVISSVNISKKLDGKDVFLNLTSDIKNIGTETAHLKGVYVKTSLDGQEMSEGGFQNFDYILEPGDTWENIGFWYNTEAEFEKKFGSKRKGILTFVVDSQNVLLELNENNNIYKKELVIADVEETILPDFYIKSISYSKMSNHISGNDYSGDKKVIAKICNKTGIILGNVSKKMPLDIYIDGKHYSDSGISSSKLRSEDGSFVCEDVSFPEWNKDDWSESKFTVKIYVDSPNDFEEVDENNNFLEKTFYNLNSEKSTLIQERVAAIKAKIRKSESIAEEDVAVLNQAEVKYRKQTAEHVSGRMLLRTEQGGEIWYVNPTDERKYSVTWDNALPFFQKVALGINNEDLNKIPVDTSTVDSNLDSDGDGYKDVEEIKNGYNPYNRKAEKVRTETKTSNRLKGRLLLQTEQGGAIWYVGQDGKRRNVRWDNLMDIFRSEALGIAESDFASIYYGALK